MPSTYSLGAFPTAVFSLGLKASEASLEPFKKAVSIFYSTLGPLDISPVGFPSQIFWGGGSCLQHRSQELGYQMWVTKSCCVLPLQGWIFGEAIFLLLLPVWMLLGRSSSSGVQIFSRLQLWIWCFRGRTRVQDLPTQLTCRSPSRHCSILSKNQDTETV